MIGSRTHALVLLLGVALDAGCTIDTFGLGDPDAGPVPVDGAERDAIATDAPGVDGGPVADGGGDDAGAGVDAGPCEMFAAQHFPPCSIPAPSPGIEITTDATYDTTDGTGPLGPGLVIVQDGGVNARLVSLEWLRIASGARLRVVGSMPLIVASWSTIEVDGELDASSELGGSIGAGAAAGPCFPATSGGSGTSGSGGGGGGGFRGRGGNGGRADGNGTSGGLPGGMGGTNVTRPPNVRGGCHGADSGGTDRGVGMGGWGGGAVQLTALDSITVTGTLHAGGAGGGGGPDSSAAGGGGGGSGGYVGLEATTLLIVGVLAANGGAGGEGCNRSTTGADGEDGRPDDVRARGGSGSGSEGTDGGDGTASSIVTGEDVSGLENGGGGGGGGGAGFILLWADSPPDLGSATVSPLPMVLSR